MVRCERWTRSSEDHHGSKGWRAIQKQSQRCLKAVQSMGKWSRAGCQEALSCNECGATPVDKKSMHTKQECGMNRNVLERCIEKGGQAVQKCGGKNNHSGVYTTLDRSQRLRGLYKAIADFWASDTLCTVIVTRGLLSQETIHARCPRRQFTHLSAADSESPRLLSANRVNADSDITI